MHTRNQRIRSVLKQIISNPKRLMSLYQPEVEGRAYLLRKYGFCQLPTLKINELFPHLNENVHHYTFLEGTSLVTDIALLRALARSIPQCHYLEIGSFRGESLVNVADVAEKCTSITLSAEEMKTIGLSKEFVSVSGVFMHGIGNLNRIEANSLSFDFSSLRQKFDLIFVDGDHSYPAVKSDTGNVLKLLKNDASVVVWHDYGNYTERVRYDILAGILDGMPVNEHKHLYHISNTMCAVYMKHKPANLETSFVSFPNYPDKIFSMNISVDAFTGK